MHMPTCLHARTHAHTYARPYVRTPTCLHAHACAHAYTPAPAERHGLRVHVAPAHAKMPARPHTCPNIHVPAERHGLCVHVAPARGVRAVCHGRVRRRAAAVGPARGAVRVRGAHVPTLPGTHVPIMGAGAPCIKPHQAKERPVAARAAAATQRSIPIASVPCVLQLRLHNAAPSCCPRAQVCARVQRPPQHPDHGRRRVQSMPEVRGGALRAALHCVSHWHPLARTQHCLHSALAHARTHVHAHAVRMHARALVHTCARATTRLHARRRARAPAGTWRAAARTRPRTCTTCARARCWPAWGAPAARWPAWRSTRCTRSWRWAASRATCTFSAATARERRCAGGGRGL